MERYTNNSPANRFKPWSLSFNSYRYIFNSQFVSAVSIVVAAGIITIIATALIYLLKHGKQMNPNKIS